MFYSWWAFIRPNNQGLRCLNMPCPSKSPLPLDSYISTHGPHTHCHELFLSHLVLHVNSNGAPSPWSRPVSGEATKSGPAPMAGGREREWKEASSSLHISHDDKRTSKKAALVRLHLPQWSPEGGRVFIITPDSLHWDTPFFPTASRRYKSMLCLDWRHKWHLVEVS